MLKITSRGIPELQAYLKDLTRGVKIIATRAFDEYLIGNESHGLKHNPPRVEHGPDNPYKWQSERQRRAYFATDGFGGGIPYNRTGKLSDGWQYKENDSNYTTSTVYNDSPSSEFVQGKRIQRGHIADGWRDMWTVIKTNTAGAIRAAQSAVDKWLKARSK